MSSTYRYLVAAIAALALGASGMLLAWSAGAQTGSANAILIQIDGLEPKDVTPETTPFLWALAHPEAPGASSILEGRNGWTWQAGRSVMSAGTAANTVALLTGGAPDRTGVTGDTLIEPQGASLDEFRLGASDGELAAALTVENVIGTPLIFDLIANQRPDDFSAAFLGDPGILPLVQPADDRKFLKIDPDSEIYQIPTYCPPPRSLGGSGGGDPAQPPRCAASDLAVVSEAFNRLDSALSNANNVPFVYLQLAELGQVKLRAGDVDTFTADTEGADRPAVQQALAQTDAAVAAFVGRFSQGQAGAWERTTLAVVGSNGYELTPQAQRVPHPDSVPADGGVIEASPDKDLEDYVERDLSGGKAQLVPQGSLATVYQQVDPAQSPADRRATISALRDDILAVNEAAPCNDPNIGPCIDEVLFVEPDPTTGSDENTLEKVHPTWKLDHVNVQTGERSGIGGDLIVVMHPGWAVGRVLPTDTQGTEGLEVSNPFTASSGGPRNRAIPVVVNGPANTVKQVDGERGDGRYPVTTETEPECNGQGAERFTGPTALAQANESPGDDVDDPGYECQPETVDVLPTLAALIGVGIPEEQFSGRFLQEAFFPRLAFPVEEEDLGEVVEPPPPPPPPSPPPVEIVVEPPKDPFDFHGLIRRLRARVVDSRGRPVSQSRPGTRLSSLELEADFGRPLSEVTLTFYQRKSVAERRRAAIRKQRRWERSLRRLRAEARRDGWTRERRARGRRLERLVERTEAALAFIRKQRRWKRSLDRIRAEARRDSWTRARRVRARRLKRLIARAPATGKQRRWKRSLSRIRAEARRDGWTRVRRVRARRLKRLIERESSRAPRSQLEARARFKPFTVERGHVTLKLKIPRRFEPTHIGVTVQEARLLPKDSRREKDEPGFEGFGDKGGGIVGIRNASRLHTVKGGERKRRRR